MKRRTQNGFTLYELLITMLIVGVVLTVGIPNMVDLTRNGRITTTSNDLHAAFHLARSESARGKTNITICASNNSMSGAPDCVGEWNEGFIVFIDTNGDLLRSGVDETVLRRHPAAQEGITMAVEDDAAFFSYAASGLGRGDVGGATALSRVVICDERGTIETSRDFSAARLFVATPLGRATIVRDKTAVDAALATMLGKTCP